MGLGGEGRCTPGVKGVAGDGAVLFLCMSMQQHDRCGTADTGATDEFLGMTRCAAHLVLILSHFPSTRTHV